MSAGRRRLRLCGRVPSLVNIRSVMEMTADSAGTGQPVWARITAQQAARKSVLFPPIFGPVSSIVCGAWPALCMGSEITASASWCQRLSTIDLKQSAVSMEIAVLSS